MSDFLEKLKAELEVAKVRMAEAQKKYLAAQADHQGATQRLQTATTEFQQAANESNSYQTLVNLWTRKEQEITKGVSDTTKMAESVTVAIEPSSPSSAPEVNKTELVCELLRQNPAGMTPSDIWAKMDKEIKNRAYLYSVLKRLKDRGVAREKRGKYFAVLRIEESQTQMVQ